MECLVCHRIVIDTVNILVVERNESFISLEPTFF